MSHLILHERPSLTRPILIAAFTGWNDAGRSASLAVEHLVNVWSASKIGEINPDEFFDFTASRPWVKIADDGQSQLTWPGHYLFAHQDTRGGLDAILLLGNEPALRWRAFTHEIVNLAQSFNVSMAVTLGSYLAQVSHRDAVPVSGWAWPAALHHRLKDVHVESITYDGPTGVVTVLSTALAQAKIPVASLWAAVPGYLGPTPNPKGAYALVSCLDRAFGLQLNLDDLRKTSEQFEQKVSEVVQRAHALPGFGALQARLEPPVAELEGTSAPITTEMPPADLPELPPADEVIRDVEEFLRQNRRR